MRISFRLIHVIFSGVLLSLPWYQSFSGLFLLLAFVPLLLVEDQFFRSSSGKSFGMVFLYASLTFFTWNVLSTWWIAEASVAGAITAIMVNTFLFSVVFLLFHLTHKMLGSAIGYSSLIIYWTAFEYYYLNAEISWPWLNLGNAFANSYQLVQWYEFTGTLGGTIWALLVNVFLFLFLKNLLSRNIAKMNLYLITCLMLIVFPVGGSFFRYYTYTEIPNPCHITLVQPNFNSYNLSITDRQKCSVLIQLADSISDDSTDYIVAPEALLEGNIWESTIDNNYSIFTLHNFVNSHKHANLILGALTYRSYSTKEAKPITTNLLSPMIINYDSYNSALQIDKSDTIQFYHKSKLVVGIEKMPYPKAFRFLKKLMEQFGGSFVSYGTQANRGVFVSVYHKARIAPVICYESIYGEFVTGYIKNGADIIFIITNDGWWGNTSGYLQHLSYARLRAIETRRSIARSASTGVSAFINQRGDIVTATKWDERTSIKGSVNLNEEKTFYVKYGDYIGKITAALSVVFLVITFMAFFLPKKRKLLALMQPFRNRLVIKNENNNN